VRVAVDGLGRLRRARAFASSTCPRTGAYSSETAFTDSIVPRTSPGLDGLPRLGRLDVDDVPELALREIGDPDRGGVTLDARTHSWSFV
jgi:hypothetical protein